MWYIIKRNHDFDMEVLKWMRAPAKPLSVKPDGAAIREFRAFYRRQVLPGWRFGDPAPTPEPEPEVAPECDESDPTPTTAVS
jgi:hypothetical protein